MSDLPATKDSWPEEARAIEQFVFKVVVPILYDHGEAGIDQIGTATLFCIADRYFIVTAQHIFNRMEAVRLSYPETPRGITPYTFGNFRYITPKDGPDFDIALIELEDTETISRLKAGWQFLSLDNISAPRAQGRFFVTGYPSKLLIPRGGNLGGTLATVHTDRLLEVPADAEQPVDLRFDMFFYYAKTAETLEGAPVNTPNLEGVSGASVWEYEPRAEGKFWTPLSAIKVVGVQKSFRHSSYFRATRWAAVAEMLRRIDAQLASTIEEAIAARARA